MNVYPTISKPTRITKNSATLIDNIFVSEELLLDCKSGILVNDMSDHLPCLLTLQNIDYDTNSPNMTITRDLSDTKLTNIKKELSDINWQETLHHDNCQDNYTTFDKTLTNVLDKHAPVKLKKMRPHVKSEPWVTPGLRKCRHKQKRLYKKFIDNRTDINETKYKEYKTTLRKITRLAKVEYYNNKCVEVKGNMKNLWLIINHAIGKTSDKTSVIESIKSEGLYQFEPKAISNELARYFASIGKKFADKTPTPENDIKHYLNKINQNKNSLFFQPTTRIEILTLINKLPNKKSSGPDGINNCFLKELRDFVVQPLEIIFNQSLSEGIFPKEMKEAHVVPLHKGKSRSESSNYRPISLLITISKILEKLVYKRVYQFLTEHCLIFNSQHGFRNKHSCETAVCELIANICKGHEKSKHTLAVFLDLSKAFDTLSHKVLYKKLDKYGIRGTTLDWFKSYLTNRQLRVKVRTRGSGTEELSDQHHVEYGAPQGSCLGPLLFLIFTNDLNLNLDHCQCILFADDTTIYITHNNERYMEWCMQTDLNKINDWFRANKLTLNANKSNCIFFHKKANSSRKMELSVSGTTIPQVTYTKFLGVWVDEKLNWNEHLTRLIPRIKRNLNLLRLSRNFLTVNVKRILYHAHIYSHLKYGISVWGHMLRKGQLAKLEKLQRESVRLIMNVRHVDLSKMRHARILPLSDIITLECSKLMYRALKHDLPTELNMAIRTDSANRSLNKSHTYSTRNKHVPRLPKCSTKIYRDSFLYHCIKDYSSLTKDTHDSYNLPMFNNHCKRELLNRTLA